MTRNWCKNILNQGIYFLFGLAALSACQSSHQVGVSVVADGVDFPAPVITSVSPGYGRVAGGGVLTLQGQYFRTGLTISVGGADCTSAVQLSGTEAVCSFPALPVGIYDVGVTNPDSKYNVLPQRVQYLSPPTVSTLSISNGKQAGGDTLSIQGTNFLSPLTISLGGAPCTTSTWVSSTLATCITGARSAGLVDATVTNNIDQQAGVATQAYTYNPFPTISGILPQTGRTNGVTLMTFQGSGYQAGATVKIGTLDCSNITVVSPTEITCVSTPQAAATYSITITNPDTQYITETNAFTYNLPLGVTARTPSGGKLAGGDLLTLLGTGFISGTTINLNGVTCASPIVVSPTKMTCIVPAGSALGTVDIVLTGPDGSVITLSGSYGYTYNPSPGLTSISPTNGKLTSGTLVTLAGNGFLSGASITIGGATCSSPNIISGTTLTCFAPANAAGPADVIITNYDGLSSTLTQGYTYNAIPSITAVSPVGGKLAGGNLITASGTGFITGATATLGGITCTSPTVISATSFTCIAPAKAAGIYPLSITNPDTQIGSLSSAYTYFPFPTLTSVSPTNGKLAGGTSITLTGTGFRTGMSVTVGASACTSVNVISATSMTCLTPANTTGVYSISTTDPDNQSGTLATAYTYNPLPTITTVSPTNGPLTGGATITITGTGFMSGVAMTIGGTACTTFAMVSSTSLTCVVPTKTAGAVSVVVTNVDTQAVTQTNAYTYNAIPTISAVSPTNGLLAGGNTITITGTGFLTGATVKLGTTVCTSPTVVSSTTLTCIAPAKTAGAYSVIVTSLDTQSVTKTNGYTYNAFPTITSISPNNGLITGGTSVTIAGTGFISGATLTIGGVACSSVVVVSTTSITCVTPANTQGVYSMIVTNADTQSGTLSNGFSYNPFTITNIAPAFGPQAGSTTITITGTQFTTGASITVGGNNCTSVNVVSSTSITCVTPAGTTGAQTVAITLLDSSFASSVGGFSYSPTPTVTAVSPSSARVSGGSTLTITGTGFLSGIVASVGGVNCTTSTYVSATSMTCVTPVGSLGTVDVRVTNTDAQTGVKTSSFTYDAAPTLTSVSPNNGKATGGNTITLTGTGFLTGTTATAGGVTCSSPTVVNSTTFTCVIGAHAAGSVNVILTLADTQTATLTNGFTYNAAPTVTSISPASGYSAGGTTVTITGTGFITGATATIGGTTCTSPTVVSGTSITCVTPARAAGVNAVVVTNPDTQTGTLSNAFTYTTFPITSVSPTSGRLTGGNLVSITGSGFVTGASVTIATLACTSPSVVNATTITCLAPAHAAGLASIAITNGDGATATLSNSYTYNPVPTLTSISPTFGALAGGATMTLTGTGFVMGATVTVGGNTCTSPTVVSATSITCIIPTGSAGVNSVVVTNADTQSATKTSAYTYDALPTITSISPAQVTKAGGVTITLTGTGFLSGATITVAGLTCTSPTLVSSTILTCVTPTGTIGTKTVVVTNTDTQQGSNSSLTYLEATDPTQSSMRVSAALAPHDGVASVRVFAIPKNSSGVLMGSGRTIEISVSSSSVTLSGAGACITPSATCKLANEVTPGVYSVIATSSAVVNPATFTAVSRAETPSVTFANASSVIFDSSQFTTIASSTTITSTSAGHSFYFTGGTSTFDSSTSGQTFGTIFVRNATLTHSATLSNAVRRLDINVASLTLLSGGNISADALGYLGGASGLQGDSYGGYSVPSEVLSSLALAGASHGGTGGVSSYGAITDRGEPYGDFKNPSYPGGGAFGVSAAYAGGGVIRVTATGMCTINSGASISADASPTYGCAGGSIYLNCSGFAGNAGATSITANGGDAVSWVVSGGGGGRIALISTGDQTTFSDQFTYPIDAASLTSIKSVIQTRGGAGLGSDFTAGGAGTLYLKNSGLNYGDLIIDNGASAIDPNDGNTEFLASVANSSTLYSRISAQKVQITPSDTPYSEFLDYFIGSWIHIYPNGASADPNNGASSIYTLSGNDSNDLQIQTGSFPSISQNYQYRFLTLIDHLDVAGYSQVVFPGADLMLMKCDLHSASATTLEIPSGSTITGNTISSPTCLQSQVSTPGSTVIFSQTFLQ